ISVLRWRSILDEATEERSLSNQRRFATGANSMVCHARQISYIKLYMRPPNVKKGRMPALMFLSKNFQSALVFNDPAGGPSTRSLLHEDSLRPSASLPFGFTVKVVGFDNL